MEKNTIPLQARHLRGNLPSLGEPYGKSLLGAPLLYFPAELAQQRSGLIIAGTHGDETAAVVTLSCALRTLFPGQRHHHVVLAVNPDGCQLGLRANANGVDLNRNFPATNWQPGNTVYRWNSRAEQRDVELSTGETPASEPETKALCGLIEKLNPAWVVSFHEPLACIEDPQRSVFGQWLAQQFDLPLVTNVGYDTPGSFGSWCADRMLPCITAELPPVSADAASECYLNAMTALLVMS
ncbi:MULTISPECIES: murein tripeptide amidase MpaA [unclassified Brenneria]|uniref:murein tripeptide amidase MpaA n=1 Tax=unclassified Brenneria TaxID=2634434 RepID=UPI001555D203|nr:MULTISPECIES: murein tripeptide amidase MpaA [unclassified Brenneria]MBJ7220944.1 murein tripeptide amidase MpaA [Brenneria sp. L3-3C-1]MEE3642185.1 murein tripeptide amidase MpaA [Brenneria sp. L3_3C_1]MEE3650442.1 murein tripeptide amidase MpaA [Brenneria sp. HEZEL_4_2_4]NPD00398.1 murein tripeptide amidase MpaA [Brenneria sp. hezel4-2-4]